MIDSGQYTYADGHIVRNDPAFFRDGVHGSRLSVWANAHVDQCCVRFARQYVQQHVGKYVFGRMNYDADYVKQTLFYVEGLMNDGERDELTATKLYQQSFPETFKEAFDQVRKQNKLSIERTAELMNLSDSTLKRWLKEPDEQISIDFIVIAALAMKLPDWISELLLDRAHKCLSKANRRHLGIIEKHGKEKQISETAEHLGGLAKTFFGETELTYEIAQAFIQNVYIYNKDQIEIEFRIEDEIKKLMACLDRRLNETKELKNG